MKKPIQRVKPLRMSLGDICSLAAYHELIGTEKPRDYNDLNLRIGSALEPMIVQMVADNGLDIYFSGTDQLEIAHEDPYRPGHPDALVGLSSYENVTPWLFERLPGEALIRLMAGSTAVLEAKALNPRNYQIFKTKGLDQTNSLMRKYYGQAQEYLHTLMDPKSDELWESSGYRALLAAGFARPSWVLFVAFNKETNDFCFRILDADTDFFQTSNARLHIEVIQKMDEGEIPTPSHSGRDAECYWCPFKLKCPAYLGLAQGDIDLDALPIAAPVDPKALRHLDELAARYYDNAEKMAELKADQERLRAQILNGLDTGVQLMTDSFRVKHGEVKGRRNLDMIALAGLAKRYGFELPYKVGAPHSRLYIHSIAQPEEIQDDA